MIDRLVGWRGQGIALQYKFLIFLSCLIFAFYSTDVSACSRGGEWSQETIYAEAKEVFRARVTNVELARHLADDPHTGRPFLVYVYYDLIETLKGSPSPTGPISTNIHYYGGCGVPVLVGVEYVFFVDEFSDEAPMDWRGESSGFISVFGTIGLPPSAVKAEEAMVPLRAYGQQQ